VVVFSLVAVGRRGRRRCPRCGVVVGWRGDRGPIPLERAGGFVVGTGTVGTGTVGAGEVVVGGAVVGGAVVGADVVGTAVVGVVVGVVVVGASWSSACAWVPS